MTFARFRQIWSRHFGKDGQPREDIYGKPKGPPIMTDSMSPHTTTALVAASKGDFSHFDRIQARLDRHDSKTP